MTIGIPPGNFSGMVHGSIFNLLFVDTSDGNGGEVSKKIDKVIHYLGEEVRVKK